MQVSKIFMHQFFLAISIKQAHIVEDTEAVSKAMSSLIIDMFRTAKKLTDHGYEPYHYGYKIMDRLIESAGNNYNRYHPRSNRIPNKRAESLIKELVAIDPSLLELTNCPQWEFSRGLPERMGFALTHNGQQLVL